MKNPPRRLALVGPTATGKSHLAHRVARELGDVEIVTVDSMQVYRGMDIGTAKPSTAMRSEVRYHLLDLVEPSDEFTLQAFQTAARDAIRQIEATGARPLLVGGTGLYVRAVVDELDIPGQFAHVREELEARQDLAMLYEELCELDPVAASRIQPENRRRIVRALEVCIGSGRAFSSFGEGLDTYPQTSWDLIGLAVERDALAERITQRYVYQMADGFIDEVEALTKRDRPISRTAGQALGYRQLLDHLAGNMTLEEALDAARAATRRFARRQRSWFGRDPRIEWIDVTTGEALQVAAETLIRRWGQGEIGLVGGGLAT